MNSKIKKYGNSQDEEIDILDLFGSLAVIIKKHLFLLIIFLILGILAGLWLSSRSKPLFKSVLVANSDVSLTDYIVFSLNSVKENVEEGNIPALSFKLNISEELAARIKEIDIQLFEPKQPGSVYSSTVFKLTLFIEDSINHQEINNAVIKYIISNELIRERITTEISNADKLLKSVSREIAQLDSLRHSDKVSGASHTYIGLMNESAVNLYEKKLRLENYLTLLKEFETNMSFSIYPLPIKDKSTRPHLIGISIAIIIAAIFIFFLEMRGKVKKT